MNGYKMWKNTNLNGEELKIAINHNPPYAYLNHNSFENKLEIVDGFEYYYLETLRQFLNFTYLLINMNKEYGRKLPNGGWNGIIGSISRNETDIGLGGVSVDLERCEVVDFARVYHYSPVTFVTKAPTIINNSKILFVIFSKNLWLSLLVSCLIISSFSKFIGIKNCFMVSLCPLLKQKIWTEIPLRLDLYFYLSSWMLFCIVISTAYAGLLSSMMTFPFLTPTIKTFSQLAKVQTEGNIHIVAHKEQCEICKQISKLTEGIDMLLEVDMKPLIDSPVPWAYISTKDSLCIAMSPNPMAFYIAIEEDSFLFMDNLAIPLRKDFKWKRHFDNLTYGLQINGLFVHWERKVYNRYKGLKKQINNSDDRKYIEENNKNRNGLKLKSLDSFFYLLIYGLLIAVIINFSELLIYHIYQDHNFLVDTLAKIFLVREKIISTSI